MFTASNDPLEIEVLVLPESTLILTASVLEPLRAANRILARPLYSWTLTTPDGQPARTTSGISIPAVRAFDPGASRAPLLIVASYGKEAVLSRDLVRRASAARRYRPAIGGVETGVFLMAEAGLLNGHSATAHWEDIAELAARFPEVDVRHDRYVIDGERFTSGGALAALDMMLELVRCRQGYALALDVSKAFLYDPGLRQAGVVRPSLGRLIRSDRRVARAVQIMEQHLAQPLAVSEIARRAGTSTRHLQSLFQQVLQMRPKAYYQSLRLNLARRQIIETSWQISEIANNVGFSNLSVFSHAYSAIHGETPSTTRRLGLTARRGPG